ncbi:YrdB family protein [Peribacillus sp. NPDC097295]|uniref:YrdB family protein n=1 Tax=Peribacillus sp. NPDC097295 TaxID=3364402 RepID=UPI0037FCE394
MVINIALRFILEVCALVFFTYWGFQSSQGILKKLVLGIGSPMLIAIIWGVFGSPAAPIPAQVFLRILLELLIFGLATLALYSSGKPTLAIIYAIIVVINLILLYIWDQ